MSDDGAEVTEFLNVDLDILSTEDLRPLVEALRPKAHALHCEKVRRGYVARLELSHQPRTPDEAIRKLSALLAGLPRGPRRLWTTAKRRELNVGIQSGVRPWDTEFPIRPETLASAARLGATIVVTVYGRPNQGSGPDR